jgi:hypothetical protein
MHADRRGAAYEMLARVRSLRFSAKARVDPFEDGWDTDGSKIERTS